MTGKFDITLGNLDNLNASECVDVMAAAGTWEVDINIVDGTVRSLMLVPRDSIAPGDSCGGVRLLKPESGSIILPGTDGAYVNSCGTEFAELVEGYALPITTADTEIASPLAFQMDMTGSKDAVVILTVTVPVYAP